MSAITTHILDLSRGRPAEHVAVHLAKRAGDDWAPLGHGSTDDDGRLKTLLPAGAPLEPGVYRLRFETAAYFEAQGVKSFYPEVLVVFEVPAVADGGREHYHVPLLLSPFGYSTYRGS